MKAKLIGVGVGVVITPLAFLLAILSAGAGHGDYVAARLLFPAPMFMTHLFRHIGIPILALAAVQFPIYGYLIGGSLQAASKMTGLMTGVFHLCMVGLIFIFPDPSFS